MNRCHQKSEYRHRRHNGHTASACTDGISCVVSESEIESQTLNDWRAVARNLVVTKGREGADLYSGGGSKPTPVSTYSHRVEGAGKDTTGAGDVFAAAILIRYAATNDAVAAAEYASLCAALSTRRPSWTAVETPTGLI